MAKIKANLITRTKWWFMPAVYFYGIYCKITFRTPSENVITWLTHNGLTMEIKCD